MLGQGRLCQTAHPSMLPPTVTVTQKGAARARAGHPWIFRADVADAPDGLISGAEVRLADARGNFIARGFWALKSPIALRVLSRQDSALEVDLLADHKTGGYLDQVENHLRAGELARGEALDAFCYHGGFSLQLARKARHVLAIDQDAAAVQRTRENAGRNDLHNVEARAQNAVEALRSLEKEGRKFDTIVLDPPAFAKRREGLEGALRAYREINYRAVRLLAPGGLLVTCSCSGRVTSELFGEVVAWASQEAKRPLQLLERRGASRDHPPLVGVPETEYLKAWFLVAP